jgi:two-component sensor histidine kinase
MTLEDKNNTFTWWQWLIMGLSVAIHLGCVGYSQVTTNEVLLVVLSFSVFIPVFVFSLYFRLWGGILSSSLIIIINLFTDFVFYNSLFDLSIILAYYSIILLFGAITGYIVSLNARLKKNIAEKELILREIHHRIKNNLAIISAMIKLESKNLTKNQLVCKKKMTNIDQRILSIGLIHEKLYNSKDLQRIDIKEYINDLTKNILDSIDEPGRIQCTINSGDYYFNSDTVIPLGMIITEIVTNAVKYGFKDSKQGEITIRLLKKESHYQLSVANNGIPISADIDISRTQSLGIKLISSLTRQLQGNVRIEREGGTTFIIDFHSLKPE